MRKLTKRVHCIFRDIDLISSLIFHICAVFSYLWTKVGHFLNRRPPEDKCSLKTASWCARTAYIGLITIWMPETSSATPKTFEMTYHMAIFRNWYFQTVLAAYSRDTKLGGYYFSKLQRIAEVIQQLKKKKTEMTYHMCFYSKRIGRIWPLAAYRLKKMSHFRS